MKSNSLMSLTTQTNLAGFRESQITDIVFVGIYFVMLILTIIAQSYSFKITQNRNLHNKLTLFFIYLTIISRILILSLNLLLRYKYSSGVYAEIEDFFNVEFPYFFMMNAQIVQFFQWLEFLVIFRTLSKMQTNQDQEEEMTEFKPRKYRIALVVACLISLLIMLLDFFSSVTDVICNFIPLKNDLLIAYPFTEESLESLFTPNYTCYYFDQYMNYLIAIKYLFITFSFVPLFIMILVTLKKGFPQVFCRLKVKLIVLYSCYVFILIFRQFIYLNLRYFRLPLLQARTNSELQLPLYVTEILQILMVCYTLLSVTSNDQKEELEKENQEKENQQKKDENKKRNSQEDKMNEFLNKQKIALAEQIQGAGEGLKKYNTQQMKDNGKKFQMDKDFQKRISNLADTDTKFSLDNFYVDAPLLNDSIESISDDSDEETKSQRQKQKQVIDLLSKIQEEPLMNIKLYSREQSKFVKDYEDQKLKLRTTE